MARNGCLDRSFLIGDTVDGTVQLFRVNAPEKPIVLCGTDMRQPHFCFHRTEEFLPSGSRTVTYDCEDATAERTGG